MTKKIVLTVMIIVALLIAVYKWIMSNDTENEEKQEATTEEVKEPANEEKENVKPEETTEEVKQNGEDTVETITNN